MGLVTSSRKRPVLEVVQWTRFQLPLSLVAAAGHQSTLGVCLEVSCK
jgi:hypothetical protein